MYSKLSAGYGICNEVLKDVHPFEYILDPKLFANKFEVELISFQEITAEEYELWQKKLYG